MVCLAEPRRLPLSDPLPDCKEVKGTFYIYNSFLGRPRDLRLALRPKRVATRETQLDKHLLISVLMEYLNLRIASTYTVITNVTDRGSGRA